MKKSHTIKKITALALMLSLFGLNPSSARADDSDIFGANIEPNVMILFDNSRSMQDDIDSSAYNATTTYTSGTKDAAKVYKPNSDNTAYNVYAQTVSAVASTSAQAALSLAGFWTGIDGGTTVNLFTGNYLNYQDCTTCNVATPKLTIARQVAADIIAHVDGVRFGVMTFRQNGATMLAEIGTDKSVMVPAVQAITAPGGVGTPLGDQLMDADRYFRGEAVDSVTYANPFQYECQPTFIIMISDGLHTTFNDDLRTVAQDFLHLDHNTPLNGTQRIILHTVGFNIAGPTQDEIDARDVLLTAAANGGGTFFEANNAAELASSLQDAIRLIIGAVFTFATPVVPTTSATGSTRAYVAAVQSDPESNFWRGYLKAYDRDTDGSIRLNPDGTPDATYLAWEAGNVLSNSSEAGYKTAAERTIYMEKIQPLLDTGWTGGRTDFLPANVVPRTAVGASSNGERDDIVNFIRGVDVYDEDGDPLTTERAWKLGDIFHSTPVLVSPPLLPISDPSYVAFRTAEANRRTVLIVGANDGMVHAFAESADTSVTPNIAGGEELWAYMMPNSLGKLKDLTTVSGVHPFFVDSSPIAADIKIGSDWKTIVVFGLRRGGPFYYALDVTDTEDPQMLWKNPKGAGVGGTYNKMGNTWSEPVIGKIKWTDGSDKFVAFVGGGYYTDLNNSFGAAVVLIDLATGLELAHYSNDGTSDDRQYMNFSFAANPTAVDLDHDGYIDRFYIGDVGGQVWKFEPTIVPGAPTPIRYKHSFATSDGGPTSEGLFTEELTGGTTFVIVKDSVDNWDPPADCIFKCYAYRPNGSDPTSAPASQLGYVGGLADLGSGFDMYNVMFIEQVGGSASDSFTLPGKRLFAAASSQANPPPVGEYFPAQAIYGAPSVAKDDEGNLWVSFGTGDRNRPLNTSANRFYGIKDNTTMDNNVSSLTESDLLEIDSGVSTVTTSVQGWYFTLAAGEKVLAQADTFNNSVFFTTFTPASTAICGGGGGTARLYAVHLTSGMASMDFTTGDALASTSGSVLKSTVIGSGIPSKPAVMIDANGNPSVVTGTTSQQISSVPVPPITTKQLLGWREVF